MAIEAHTSIKINNLKYVQLMQEDSNPYSLESQKSLLDTRSSILEKVKSLGRTKRLGLSASSGLLFMGLFMDSSAFGIIGGVTLITSAVVSYMHSRARTDFRLVEELRVERGLEFVTE